MATGWPCIHAWADCNRAHREAVGDALSEANDIGCRAVGGAGEQGTTTTKASLHFIENQQHPVRTAQLTGRAKVASWGAVDAAFALHGLENHSRSVFVDCLGEGFNLAVVHMADIGEQRRKRSAIGRLVRDRSRAKRTSVEATRSGDQLAPPGRGARQLERGFDGFGARVAEEEAG